MSETPPHRGLPGSRDRTPELTSKRETRHDGDDHDHDRKRERSERGSERRSGRDREGRDDRDRSRDYDRSERRRHDDETEEEREERRRRRREREREREGRGEDDRHRHRDYERSERDRDREPERERRGDRSEHRSERGDRSVRSERDGRTPRERSRPRSRERRRDSRSPPRVRYMTREEKEAERERRDREMQEERREAARHDGHGGYDRRRSREASQLLDEVDAEARSVFVSQIAARLTSSELGMFFEDMLGRGTVRDARVITDKGRRSKGMGYVTLAEPKLVNKALNLTGRVVMGIPIHVGLTPADSFEGMSLKSIIQSLRGDRDRVREQRDMNRPRPNRYPPLSIGVQLAAGVTDPDAHSGAAIPYHRLYITSLSEDLTAEDLRQVFEPFGDIEFVDVHRDPRGVSKGTAYIQFADLSAAQMALDAMNGFELAGKAIKVETVEERTQNRDVIEENGRGNRMNNDTRMALMQKLARTDRTDGTAARPTPPPRKEVLRPTHFLVVSNMFNPDEETERNWDLDLADDVHGEVESKYGHVARVKVDKMSQGDVYIEFKDIDSSERALRGLSGRFFGGRKLEAQYISETLFKAHL